MSVYLGRVNQKLFNARQLLADIDAASDIRRRQMLQESLLLQLHLACRFHLRHIADQYRCREPEAVDSPADLLQQLDAIDKAPGEAGEIQMLEHDPRSWWSRIDASWRHCFHIGGQGKAGEAMLDAGDRVPLVTVDVAEDFNVDLGRRWLADLTEMVERHREVMVEC